MEDENGAYSEITNDKALEVLTDIYRMSRIHYKKSTPITSIIQSEDFLIESIKNCFTDLTGYDRRIVSRIINKYLSISEFDDDNYGQVYAIDEVVSRIKLMPLDSTFAASIAVHEYTHVLNINSLKDMVENRLQVEILPLTNQLIYSHFIDEKGDFNKSFEDYVLHQQLFYNLKNFVSMIDILSDDNVSENTKNKLYARFEEHYRYTLGGLYSLILYDFYKYDPKLFYRQSKKIYQNNESVLDLIDYYGVTLLDREAVNIVRSYVKKE